MSDRTIQEGFVSQYCHEDGAGEQDKIFYPVTGRFIQIKDDPSSLQLYDDNIRYLHQPSNVALLLPVSSQLEGKKKFPRPWIYERTAEEERRNLRVGSKLVTPGDIVLINYVGGNLFTPIVVGSVEALGSIAQKKFLHFDPKNLDRQAERYENDKYTYEFENDGKGGFTLNIVAKEGGSGDVTIDVTGQAEHGKVQLRTNGATTLQQVDRTKQPADEGFVKQSLAFDQGGAIVTFAQLDEHSKPIHEMKLDKTTKRITLKQFDGDTELQHIILDATDGIHVQGQKDKKNEYAVYGETLKQKLEAILTAITQLTVPTPAGVSGVPNNSAAFNQIKSKLEEILVQ